MGNFSSLSLKHNAQSFEPLVFLESQGLPESLVITTGFLSGCRAEHSNEISPREVTRTGRGWRAKRVLLFLTSERALKLGLSRRTVVAPTVIAQPVNVRYEHGEGLFRL